MPNRSASRAVPVLPLPRSAPATGRALRRAAAGLALGVGAGVVTGLLQKPAMSTSRPGQPV